MPRTFVLSLLIYSLIVLGFITLERRIIALAFPLLLYLGAGLIYAPSDIKLTITRQLSADRVPYGQAVAVVMTVVNEGAALENLLIEDHLPAGLVVSDGENRIRTPLAAGASIQLAYSVQGPRGYYQFHYIHSHAQDSLGLFRKVQNFVVSDHIFILPEVNRLPRIALKPRRTRVYPGVNRARKGGPGVEFFGIREYQAGDSLRWINKRLSARHAERLFVNEFEQERAIDVGLILDARQKSNLNLNGHSLFEYSIQATTTLADTFLAQGNRVGLFIYGGYLDWTFPGSGKRQRERILQALARAEMQESLIFQRLSHLPTRLFPARSQLVFISPLLVDDLGELIKLRAHGYPLMVISPDPVAFEVQQLAASAERDLAYRIARLERKRLLQRLSQLGIRMFSWEVEQPFHEQAQLALAITPIIRGTRL